MKQPLFFRIYKDGQLVEIKQVQDAQVIIGSNDDVGVSLKDENVSPIHAMIEERETGYFICDLGSGQGTIKNGEAVLDDSVQSGDELQIGPFTIEFYIGVPKPKTRPPRVSATPPTPVASNDEIYDQRPVEPEAPAKAAVPKPQPPAPIPVAAAPAQVVKPKATEPAKPSVEKSSGHRAQTFEKPKDVNAQPQWQKVETPKKSQQAQKQATAFSRGGAGLQVFGSTTKEKKSHSRWGRTFAPVSYHRDLKNLIKPTKGTCVEVVVAWKERIIGTHHFTQKGVITIGSHPKNNIIVPVFGSATISHPLIKLEGAAKVFITSDFKGELQQGDSSISLSDAISKGKAETSGAGYFITLQQGELIRIDFADSVSIYVRYVNQAPKPLAAPFLDLTTTEISAIVASVVISALLWLYVAVYAPQAQPEETKPEEPQRKAVFTYKQKVEAVDLSKTEATPPKKAKLADKKTSSAQKAPVPNPQKQKAESSSAKGKAAEAMPNKSNSQERKLTTPNAGKSKGAQKAAVSTKAKTNDAQGGAKKDLSHTGILSVLSGKGAQDELSKVYSGAGVVGGLSQKATGSGAQSAVGAGDTPGEGLKDIGKGGKGEATVGISGVNTKGRGSGNEGYGTGSIGDKKGTAVIPGGAEESFDGTIDKEAIRRVIIANMRQIKACYERALNRDPNLEGKVVLKWLIGDGGRVVEASVASSTMASADVEQCMVRALKTWRFPEPPANKEAEVQYPYVFRSQQ